jgi:DNA-binding transcriptional LysR family regulator
MGPRARSPADKSSQDAVWWNRIELRNLHCFIALAEEMHFGRAAQRLNMAQPVLSRKIARLEADLGGELFDRTRSQIKLTAAGITMLPKARELMQRLVEMAEVTHRVAAGGQGRLDIGFVSSATFSILPELIREYHRRYPLVELRLQHLNKVDLIHALIERRLHIAFTRAGIDDAEIVNDSVWRERMIVALPEGDPLGEAPSLLLHTLADRPFIIPNASVDDHVRNMCAQVGFRPTIVQEPMDIHTALSLVAAGLGLALVPESARRSPRQGVIYRMIDEPVMHTDFMLSYRRDNTETVLHIFRNLVKQHKKNLQRPV